MQGLYIPGGAGFLPATVVSNILIFIPYYIRRRVGWTFDLYSSNGLKPQIIEAKLRFDDRKWCNCRACQAGRIRSQRRPSFCCICICLEPKWPVFLGVELPFDGSNLPKYGSFGVLGVYIYIQVFLMFLLYMYLIVFGCFKPFSFEG